MEIQVKLRELLSLTEEQDDLIARNRLKDLEQDDVIEAIESYNQKQDNRLKEHKEHLHLGLNHHYIGHI